MHTAAKLATTAEQTVARRPDTPLKRGAPAASEPRLDPASPGRTSGRFSTDPSRRACGAPSTLHPRDMDLAVFERDGLVLSRAVLPFVESHRVLSRAVEVGALHRLRRGAYVAGDRWARSSARERHLLRLRAVAADARGDVVAAGPSAAAVWGMPLAQFPECVTLLEPWKGGGRSEPGVRRTARAAGRARAVVHDGFTCTTLARTAVDVARGAPFGTAVATLDWALSRRNDHAVNHEDLVAELEHSRPPRVLRMAVAFATHLSDSFGESEARATMHQLGFAAPKLQHPFVDEDGRMEVDFAWLRYGVVCEFDGKIKYTRTEYTHGDPSEVVWREKKREDRLRRLVRTVVRITTDDVRTPARLRRLLLDAGVPCAA